MKLALVCLFLTVCTCPYSDALRSADTFEFGTNVGYIGFTTSGSIGMWEKLKRISVVIPDCTELTYVRVDVNNMFGPPSVKFEKESSSVIIQYSPLQISVSQYTISAKVERLKNCYSNGPSTEPKGGLPVVEIIG